MFHAGKSNSFFVNLIKIKCFFNSTYNIWRFRSIIVIQKANLFLIGLLQYLLHSRLLQRYSSLAQTLMLLSDSL